MHDLRLLREQPELLREAMRRRGALEALAPRLDHADALEQQRRALIQAVEERKARRNQTSQEVARLRKTGGNADELIASGRALGEEIGRLESELAAAESGLQSILLELPNITLDDVPEGDENRNVVVRSWGAPRDSAGIRPHWEIADELGMLDLARGAKISGSGFMVFRGRGARLVRAMVNFFIESHVERHGYEELWMPLLVNRATMTGTGQLPKFEDDMYRVDSDDLFLVPTAEVPVTNLYRDEIIDGATLPRAFVAYTPCFRREAGAAGKDTRGLLRVHQFDKVELVRYSAPETSSAELELLTVHAAAMLEAFELPYRVKLLAAGDTGFSSAKTYDLEVWAPGVGAWLEVSSSSCCTDFQARRANIRFRAAPGEKPRFVHTLNASGLAFPRVIAAMLEHHQQPDGSVTVPAALRPYLGIDTLR
ncbi:MAG TPA: serine--tRNA ligase [Gemmatimonadaceae bacterium]|nr:serine--tRNA ligase [Gemmatimonadaceae bacterium]